MRSPTLFCSTILLMSAATGAQAQQPAEPAPDVPFARALNDTGQTRCTRDLATFTTNCAGTGQDASSGRDVDFPAPANGHAGFAFVKVCNSGEAAGTGTCSAHAVLGTGPDDWGCVIDRVTALEWEVKEASGGVRDFRTLYTNHGDGRPGDASAFVATVNANGLCGESDWRLPAVDELQGLADYGRASPQASIDPRFFPNTLAGIYWTQENSVAYGEHHSAWTANFAIDGTDVGTMPYERLQAHAVRLVRPAQGSAKLLAQRDARATSAHDIEVAAQHVFWQRCSVGQEWNGTSCIFAPRVFTAERAIAYAKELAAETGLPWRVPNVKELSALALRTRVDPAMDTSIFPGASSTSHWTSTVNASSPAQGWAVDFGPGAAFTLDQSNRAALRLIRDAD